MADVSPSQKEILPMEHENMNEALIAISEEAQRLLMLCPSNSDLQKGLDLIFSCASYKKDVRSADEIEQSRSFRFKIWRLNPSIMPYSRLFNLARHCSDKV